MTNNDILRRLRYILNIKNNLVIEIFSLANTEMDEATLDKLLLREEDEGYINCNNDLLDSFLDGVITFKRGKQERKTTLKEKPAFTNNLILKKLRIAFELKDTDILEALQLAEIKISKSELNAFFRNERHRNYMECQTQILRKFLTGLEMFLKK